MSVVRFEVSGVVYEFDIDPDKVMGDEWLLIEEHANGDLAGWGQRLVEGRFGIREILLVTYLAARRRGESRPFAEFIRGVAPTTFRELPADEADVPAPPNRAARRATPKRRPAADSEPPASVGEALTATG